MRYLWHHIEQIRAQYDGAVPLHHFLKSHFKANPRLGSRDRRGLSDAVYAWYRAGKSLHSSTSDPEETTLAAMFLCGLRPKAFASFFPPSWPEAAAELPERIRVLEEHGFVIQPEKIFPYEIALSPGMSPDEWRISMLRQPRLFLRIRNQQEQVRLLLEQAGIEHQWLSDTCLALPNGTKVENLLSPELYVVQDASSQETGKFLVASANDRWWDCCSGAGGKSLMLKDGKPEVSLVATDVRQSILNNLADRFRLYGHKLPELAVLDTADEAATRALLGDRRFDGIICDVPCTGSGTWARTPESCFFFRPDSVSDYTRRQKAILRNASRYLKPQGRIVYITCSVFRVENEEVVEECAAAAGLRVVSAGLVNGLSIAADSLFAAELVPVQ